MDGVNITQKAESSSNGVNVQIYSEGRKEKREEERKSMFRIRNYGNLIYANRTR